MPTQHTTINVKSKNSTIIDTSSNSCNSIISDTSNNSLEEGEMHNKINCVIDKKIQNNKHTPSPRIINKFYNMVDNVKNTEYIGNEYQSISDDEDDDIGKYVAEYSNSRHNSEVSSDIDENSITSSTQLKEIMQKLPPPRKIGFNDVKNVVRITFFSNEDYNSTAFDILSTYIKGQKILYMEAKSHCDTHLNMLMLPTIFLSAVASVLSLTIGIYDFGPVIVSSVNAFNGFLLALVNYSRLDAASEAHKITSHQYDKLQSLCEFTSGKLMMSRENGDKEDIIIKNTISEVEAKIKDIKETNSFIIPSTVRSRFMNVYYLNIFSVVKKIRDNESLLINTLRTKLNYVRNLEYLNKINPGKDIELNNRINKINYEITDINSEIIKLKTRFTVIDKMFKNEIRRSEKLKRRGWFISSCCFTFNDDDEYENIQHFNYNKNNIRETLFDMKTIQ